MCDSRICTYEKKRKNAIGMPKEFKNDVRIELRAPRGQIFEILRQFGGYRNSEDFRFKKDGSNF